MAITFSKIGEWDRLSPTKKQIVTKPEKYTATIADYLLPHEQAVLESVEKFAPETLTWVIWSENQMLEINAYTRFDPLVHKNWADAGSDIQIRSYPDSGKITITGMTTKNQNDGRGVRLPVDDPDNIDTEALDATVEAFFVKVGLIKPAA